MHDIIVARDLVKRYGSYGENRGLDELPLVGFDVVEVAPAYDSAYIALLAANLVYEPLTPDPRPSTISP